MRDKAALMDNRELLELAAKAAGVCLHPRVNREYGNWGCDTSCCDCGKDPSDARWDPLTDDGDALRLAVRLELLYSTSNAAVESFIRAQFEPDPCAATRRAIVCAAAEVGRRS